MMLKQCKPQRDKYSAITVWPSKRIHFEGDTAVAVSFDISGSGAQSITKGLFNCILWTLTRPTFQLRALCPTHLFPVIPASVNQEIHARFALLEPAVIVSDKRIGATTSQTVPKHKSKRSFKHKPTAKELVFRIIEKGTARPRWGANLPIWMYKIDLNCTMQNLLWIS
jgi:hypothetical protein